MRPIVPLTLAFAVAAVGAAWLPTTVRAPAWWTLASLYLVLTTWGTVSLRSGIFGRAFTRGVSRTRQVALTYDDGPDPGTTPALLDLLRQRGAPAAFFCVGTKVERYPEIARRCHCEGHLLANHSHRHAWNTNFLVGRFLHRELEACQEAIEVAAGVRPAHYRPPFGLTNHALSNVARRTGLCLVGWDVRSFDTSNLSSDAVAQRVLRRVRCGSIVLLHDGGLSPQRVVDITSRILDGLDQQGFSVVRLDRLEGGE